MEIAEFRIEGAEAKCVTSVFIGLEVQRQFTLGFGADDGIVLAILRNGNVGKAFAKIELRKLIAFVEADDGVVDPIGAACIGLSKGNLEVAAARLSGRCLLAEGDRPIAEGFHDDTLARRHGHAR